MRRIGSGLLTLALLLSVGCASLAIRTTGERPAPVSASKLMPAGSPLYRLGIPLRSFPEPGECRVWHPGAPASGQPAPGICSLIEPGAGAGDWLLYRSAEIRELVEVSVYHPRRRVTRVIAVNVYDFETGRLLP